MSDLATNRDECTISATKYVALEEESECVLASCRMYRTQDAVYKSSVIFTPLIIDTAWRLVFTTSTRRGAFYIQAVRERGATTHLVTNIIRGHQD